MRARQTISRLAAFRDRGPGTDAERRAALWLAEDLREDGHRVAIEQFWCRPNWAMAHAWHAALALAGSLVSVASPRIGLIIVLVALVSIVADAVAGVSLGRALTHERASQNVVARPGVPPGSGRPAATRLVIVSNYDTGRTGLIYGAFATRLRALLRRLTGGRGPGWMAWLALAVAWIAVAAAIRTRSGSQHLAGILQVVPSGALVVTFALLVEAATARFSPGAGDNASGTAVGMTLFRALEAGPPRNLRPELVLCGAHEGGAIGLRRYLRAHRRELRASNTIVLGIAASGAGRPRWWLSDGPFVPVRYSPPIERLCRRIAHEFPDLGAGPDRGRGLAPALAARQRLSLRSTPLPAMTLGALDASGLVPRSHQNRDWLGAIDHAPAAEQPLDQVISLALLLIDAIDEHLSAARPKRSAGRPTPPAGRPTPPAGRPTPSASANPAAHPRSARWSGGRLPRRRRPDATSESQDAPASAEESRIEPVDDLVAG